MKLINIDYIPGQEFDVLGLVKGNVVQSKNLGKDIGAGFKTLVGGELKGYTEMLQEARQIATKRMVDEAESLGADAVIGMRFASSAIMQGAAEVIAYGTAVIQEAVWKKPMDESELSVAENVSKVYNDTCGKETK